MGIAGAGADAHQLAVHYAGLAQHFLAIAKLHDPSVTLKSAAVKPGKTSKLLEDGTPKPKREPTAYNTFIKSRMAEFVAEHPNMPQTERMSALAAEWKNDPSNPKAGAAPVGEQEEEGAAGGEAEAPKKKSKKHRHDAEGAAGGENGEHKKKKKKKNKVPEAAAEEDE